jgi:excisionase family DNA binding protein
MVAAEVAQLLNVPESWVRDAGLDGRLPSIKVGFYRRYRRQDVLAWLESQAKGRR